MITTIILIITLSALVMIWAVYKTSEAKPQTESPQELHSDSPASEDSKNAHWDPDDYKPLSQSDYEVFDEDDIEDAREQLTTHQRIHLGGR